MSLRTRIKGFTAWVNMRLMSYNHLLNNVLMDILTGTHMKYLVESLTGRDIKRLESFDGLSQQQKQTRIEWIVEELKKCNLVPDDISVDSRLFAMRSADHVFDLLWRLISHDILFVWERAEYLQHDDEDVLTQVPFKWTPEPPPKKKKGKKSPKKSLLSGFGPGSNVDDEPEEDLADWVKFPNAEYCKNFKKRRPVAGMYPGAEKCILEMINYQLKTTRDGKNIYVYSVEDLVDSRVLCALINSFVPNTFTTDLLLNDRWTINLALRTAEKMFYTETPFDSEDLVEADPMSVCAYFGFFFMVAYKLRQCRAVLNRVAFINMLIREANHELDKFPPIVANLQELQRRKDLKQEIEMHKKAIEKIKSKFDVEYSRKWLVHVESVKGEVRREIRNKMSNRFDIVEVPRSITVNDICLSFVINLSLTNGSGFYLATSKETLPELRKVVVKKKETGEFVDDFGKAKGLVRKLLELPEAGVVDIIPSDYPDLEIFVEAPSRNKQLKPGSLFLYQVFPGNTLSWQRHFIKSARENEIETVEKMIVFFQSHPQFINAKEPKSGNTALHWACRNGHFDVARLLLENGANIDARNLFRCTPIFSAIEGLQRKVCHLLIEWGCDVHCRNSKNLSPFESVKNDDFKKYLIELYEYYSRIVPKIMGGDMAMFDEVLRKHVDKEQELCCLRSRLINGSTLLHTASYYGHIEGLKEVLRQRVDVNVRDYKGATALHRAKNTEVLELMLDAGALVDAEDTEGNTPLHVKCYGESHKPSEISSIELLLDRDASLTKRNFRDLLPIHCCAMQGRIDLMKLMMKHDTDAGMPKSINQEDDKKPPSLLHLSIANDFMDCAEWLISSGFFFKEREQDILLRRILSQQIKLQHRDDAVKFLLENGADPNPRYPGGNSALQYAAGLSGSTEVLDLLLSFGSEVDAVNEDGCTPLFFATQSDNQYAASSLVEHGANYRLKNNQGLTALDYIVDYDEWIDCGYFGDEIKARLKAYNLKHARDLIRAISKKVKTSPFHPLLRIEEPSLPMTATGTGTRSLPGSRLHTPITAATHTSHLSLTSSGIFANNPLPPLRRISIAAGYLMKQ